MNRSKALHLKTMTLKNVKLTKKLLHNHKLVSMNKNVYPAFTRFVRLKEWRELYKRLDQADLTRNNTVKSTRLWIINRLETLYKVPVSHRDELIINTETGKRYVFCCPFTNRFIFLISAYFFYPMAKIKLCTIGVETPYPLPNQCLKVSTKSSFS